MIKPYPSTVISVPMRKDRFAVLLCGHGSRVEASKDQCLTCSRHLAAMISSPVHISYLEFCRPTLTQGLEYLANQNFTKIIVAPLMLFAGKHMVEDIPGIMQVFANNYSGQLVLAQDIGADDRLVGAVEGRIKDRLAANKNIQHLVFVGRGHGEMAINDQVSAIGQGLAKRLGLELTVCFAGTAKPSIEDGIAMALKKSDNLILVPYLLFEGLLMERLRQAKDAAEERWPNKAIYNVDVIGPDLVVAEILADRIHGAVERLDDVKIT